MSEGNGLWASPETTPTTAKSSWLRSRIRQAFVYIDQIAILRSAQGTGVGRLLYEALAQCRVRPDILVETTLDDLLDGSVAEVGRVLAAMKSKNLSPRN